MGIPSLIHVIGACTRTSLKAYILEATKAWNVQHEFSDLICDIVFIRHKITLSQGDATKANPSSF